VPSPEKLEQLTYKHIILTFSCFYCSRCGSCCGRCGSSCGRCSSCGGCCCGGGCCGG